MKESDIRPQELHDEYIRLCNIDADRFFPIAKERYDINCPACNSQIKNKAFEKQNFGLEVCTECESMFVSPRPPARDFFDFYKDSPSSTYWAEVFFPSVMDARRENMFKPKAEEISKIFLSKSFNVETVIDVGAGHGIFLEEWQKINPNSSIYAVEPGKKMADICRSKGIETLEKIAEEAEEFYQKGDLVTSFEVIEHSFDPLEYIKALKKLSKKDGYVLISGLTVDGLDIQILGKSSKAIAPPFHLNFLSVEGFKKLFERAGFSEIEVITPGKLDLDIVLNTFSKEELNKKGLNFLNLINKRGDKIKDKFQEFLRDSKLSSHIWVIARV